MAANLKNPDDYKDQAATNQTRVTLSRVLEPPLKTNTQVVAHNPNDPVSSDVPPATASPTRASVSEVLQHPLMKDQQAATPVPKQLLLPQLKNSAETKAPNLNQVHEAFVPGFNPQVASPMPTHINSTLNNNKVHGASVPLLLPQLKNSAETKAPNLNQVHEAFVPGFNPQVASPMPTHINSTLNDNEVHGASVPGFSPPGASPKLMVPTHKNNRVDAAYVPGFNPPLASPKPTVPTHIHSTHDNNNCSDASVLTDFHTSPQRAGQATGHIVTPTTPINPYVKSPTQQSICHEDPARWEVEDTNKYIMSFLTEVRREDLPKSLNKLATLYYGGRLFSSNQLNSVTVSSFTNGSICSECKQPILENHVIVRMWLWKSWKANWIHLFCDDPHYGFPVTQKFRLEAGQPKTKYVANICKRQNTSYVIRVKYYMVNSLPNVDEHNVDMPLDDPYFVSQRSVSHISIT